MVVSLEELFRMKDTDGDGFITMKELVEVFEIDLKDKKMAKQFAEVSFFLYLNDE